MKQLNFESNENVIETHGLSKSYKGVFVLKNLDLRVPRNSIFGFLGPNGAGKTTTIRCLLGLAAATSGNGTVFGMDIAHQSTEIRRRTGYLAQDPRYYEYMTAREILRFTAQFFYTGPKLAIQERIEETLNLVGLEDKADRPVKGFSGGERQRLGIAQALINNPELVFLDEPMSGLDPLGRREARDLMLQLRAEGKTIFFSTHILSDAETLCDRVAILNRGRLQGCGDLREILAVGISTTELVVEDPNPQLARELELCAGRGVRTGERVRFEIPNESDVSRVLDLVLRHGAKIVSLHPVKMSLEDYFMAQVTGVSGSSADEARIAISDIGPIEP